MMNTAPLSDLPAVTAADFPTIMESIRRAGIVLGDGFDEPAARAVQQAAPAPAKR